MKLENLLASFKKVDGVRLWSYVSPLTNKRIYTSNPRSKTSREASRVLGRIREGNFDDYWKFAFEQRFGKLEVIDRTQSDHYASKPDRYNAKLQTYFEFKNKTLNAEEVRNQQRDRGLVWINKFSIDKKEEYRKNDPSNFYMVVIYFEDEGYFICPTYEVAKCKSAFRKSDDVYLIPLEYILRVPFELYVEAISEGLGLT